MFGESSHFTFTYHVISFILRLFTRTVNVTIFMSGTFDLFDVLCKQHTGLPVEDLRGQPPPPPPRPKNFSFSCNFL